VTHPFVARNMRYPTKNLKVRQPQSCQARSKRVNSFRT